MKTYFGSFYRPGYTEPIETTVLVFDKTLSIGFRNPDGSNATVDWPFHQVSSSFEFGRQRTRVVSAGHSGMELFIEGNDADKYIKELQAERQKPWHQKSSGKEWIRNILLFLGIAAFLFLIYLLIVPWLSSKLANKVSIRTERSLGDAVYNGLNLKDREDTVASFVVNEFFATMEVQTAYPIRITVINDPMVNAFALPGGRIVVYSGLLEKLETYPELAALLSHEFTHVNNKHSTKSIFRKLGSKIFLSLLFGRLNYVTTVVVNHADDLKSLKYTRSLEKEADMEGLDILKKRGIDPAGFSNLFEELKKSANASGLPEFLNSHPDTDTRIAYVKEASNGSVVKEDAHLKAIFEKLNKTNNQ